MTINDLYNKLEDPFFQDTDTGSIFYNVYIYLYKPEEEYQIRDQIENFKSRLKRPNHNLDILSINLFEAYCAFLDNKPFGKKNPSMLRYLVEKEQSGTDVTDILIRNACNEDFLGEIHRKIQEHIRHENNLKKSFVFLYGIGQLFPYLRTNTFLSNFERYNKGEHYKLIVFYPGHARGNSFSLFDKLEDDNTYRSIKLIDPQNFANI